MYSETNDMLEALMRYGVSELGIHAFWSFLAEEDGKQWHTDTFYSEEIND